MSYHSVEVMVYQYDKLFGCPNPNPHFYILVGYFWGTVILNWLPWQPAGKFRVPQKYKTVGYGWDTSHPTTISKKFIILIYHYLHAVPAPHQQTTANTRTPPQRRLEQRTGQHHQYQQTPPNMSAPPPTPLPTALSTTTSVNADTCNEYVNISPTPTSMDAPRPQL